MNRPYIALTLDEVKALFAATLNADDVRFHTLLLLGLWHGLRISELLSLTRANFFEAGGKMYVTVARLKGSEKTTQEVVLHPDPLLDERAVVVKYLASLKDDQLFSLGRSGADFLFKRYAERAGLAHQKRHCHVLKHTLGTLMRKNGADLVQIKHALGHADIRSTMAYLRPTVDEVEDARIAAVSGCAFAAAAAR